MSVIACNLGNLWRRLALPLRVGNWSWTSLQQRLVKTGGRLVKHAVVLAAFNFVEAFLNGLARDYFYAQRSSLDDAVKSDLLDWDFKRGKPRLSLRDKALKYPKIILGTPHPPLQESNCPEPEFIVHRAKALRDSLVHPAPDVDITGHEASKEIELFNVDFLEVERIVDNSVRLARKLETCVRGNEDRLFWLYDRGRNGLFPTKAFD